MKKFLALILSVVMVLSCSSAFALVEEGKLVMGTNAEFPPFEITDDEGNVVGFDADLAAEIAKDLGVELEIKNMPFDSIVTAVVQGGIDVGIAGMTVKPERLASVDFSNTYYEAQQVVIVKEGSPIVDEDTLKGVTIGVQEGTTGQWTAEEYTDMDKISAYKKALDAVMDLQGGKVDCVIVDDHTAAALLSAINDPSLIILDIEFEVEEYAIAIAKNQPELLASINATLERITTDGTFDAMVEKWLGSETEDEAADEGEATEETETTTEAE